MEAVPIVREEIGPGVDQRIHWLVSNPLVVASEFNQKLFHRQEVAQKGHARWAAHRIAAILKRSYVMADIRFVSDTMLNSELRKYNVATEMWPYGRKVVLERLRKAWSV